MVEAALLNLVIWLPLAGAVFTLLFADEQGRYHTRAWSAVTTAIALVATVWLYVRFDTTAGGYQFVSQANWLQGTAFNFGAGYAIGLDGISMPLELLNSLLGFLAVLISYHS